MDLIEYLKEHSDSYFTFRYRPSDEPHFLDETNHDVNPCIHLYAGNTKSGFLAVSKGCDNMVFHFLVQKDPPYWFHRPYAQQWTSISSWSAIKSDRLVIQTGKWKRANGSLRNWDDGRWHNTEYELRAGSDCKYYLYCNGVRYRKPESPSYSSDDSDSYSYSDSSYSDSSYSDSSYSDSSYSDSSYSDSSYSDSSYSDSSYSSSSSSSGISSSSSSNGSQNNGKKAKGGVSILTFIVVVVIAYFIIKAIT